jgi:uncharacterized membrane protein
VLSDDRIAQIATDAGVPSDVVDRFADRTYEPWVAAVTRKGLRLRGSRDTDRPDRRQGFLGRPVHDGTAHGRDREGRRRMSTPATSSRTEARSDWTADRGPGLAGRLHRVRHSNAAVWIAMLVASAASLVASFVLSIDALRLAENPNADLGCNLNAVISCSTVAGSWQSSVLGFPNAFLGLVTEPVVITLAVASLGGARFPRWFMCSAQVAYTVGLAFAYWLFEQAMFDIGALCPWCMPVTLATTLVFFEMTYANIRDDNLFLSPRLQAALTAAIRSNLDLMALVAWLLVLVLAVVLKYGEALFA